MAQHPADPVALWTRHMRHGRFSAAWRVSDKVLRSRVQPNLPRHQQILWRGAPLAGQRVIIRCYRGLGDTINFIRYVPLLKALAAKITVSAQAELLPLLRTMSEIDCLVPLERDGEQQDYDVEVEVTELPHVFRTTVSTIPAHVPYFQVPPTPLPVSPGLAVGFVWAAGDWDHRRTIARRHLAPLTGLPGISLYSFQRGEAAADARAIGALPVDWEDILHEAALLQSLDLLISVDTMPAHLAGALAVPVWLLLHSEPDWRWMVRRDDSPWYPTMRLFRQQHAGQWQPVVQRVAAELRDL